jgi:DNA-binding PadR family transcriptional regulator
MALTNVEIALLGLNGEKQQASGYELAGLIEIRGYRNWAGIGRTSIYNTLLKLLRKGFISVSRYEKSSGRGPAPKKCSLTMEGFGSLKKEVLAALASGSRGNNAFELAIATIPMAGFKASAEALIKRTVLLKKEIEELKGVYMKQGGEKLPVFVRALFERPLKLIDTELKYTEQMAKELNNVKRKEG